MDYNTYEDNIRDDISCAIDAVGDYDKNIAEMLKIENPQNNQELIDALYDFLESNNITGNIDGSYFCNRASAREFVLNADDTHDILERGLNNQMITSADVGRLFIDEDWELLDVLIREVDFSLNYEYYICEVLKAL